MEKAEMLTALLFKRQGLEIEQLPEVPKARRKLPLFRSKTVGFREESWGIRVRLEAVLEEMDLAFLIS